jgi:nucleoside-diphosphate-sugar epimerase
MARFLVTGGAGFIGSHLAQALLARGDDVRVLDNLSSGRRENLEACEATARGRMEFVQADLRERAALERAVHGVDGIFHEAAQVSVPQSVREPELCYAINVGGTLGLLEAARKAGVTRLVFAASSAAYGDAPTLPKEESMLPQPQSPYAASKVAGEQMLSVWGRCFGMHTVSLRYFNVFGPRQQDDSPYTGVIALFAKALLEGRAPTIFGDGEQTRDFTYVDNVVSANLLAMDARVPTGSVFNVGTGERITVNQLYQAMAQFFGSKLAVQRATERAGDVRHSLASMERARTQLGYSPKVPWRVGLDATLAWYRERHARR